MNGHPITLAIDIGGSGVKWALLDDRGKPLAKRRRADTPRPATPPRVIRAIRKGIKVNSFDRVAVGFPGWVEAGVIRSAPNLDPEWISFDLENALRDVTERPVRVINDAEIQGLGHISGEGLEIVLTLGTGVGSAVFMLGKVVPRLDIGQQRGSDGKTYWEQLRESALKDIGVDAWRKRVTRMIAELEPVWNYDRLYLGGGNARHLKRNTLPPQVSVVSNEGGLWGGHILWEHPEAIDWSEATLAG